MSSFWYTFLSWMFTAVMQWAVEMGIIKGDLDGTLNPHGHASRAHVAAFAERYVNAI